jgi:hypothetical protein
MKQASRNTVLHSTAQRLETKRARNYVTTDNEAYVDIVFFIQNDSYNNFKKYGRPYAENYI